MSDVDVDNDEEEVDKVASPNMTESSIDFSGKPKYIEFDYRTEVKTSLLRYNGEDILAFFVRSTPKCIENGFPCSPCVNKYQVHECAVVSTVGRFVTPD